MKSSKTSDVTAIDFFVVRFLTGVAAIPGILLFGFLTYKYKAIGAIIGIIIIFVYMIPLSKKITARVTKK